MNVLIIFRFGSRYDIKTGQNSERFHVLNQRSLEYFLKHQAGLKKKEITTVINALLTQDSVVIERVSA
jgi:hypothetical protein